MIDFHASYSMAPMGVLNLFILITKKGVTSDNQISAGGEPVPAGWAMCWKLSSCSGCCDFGQAPTGFADGSLVSVM